MPAIQIDIITVSVQGYIECQEHVYVLGSFLRRFQSFKQASNTLGLFPHPGIWLTIFSNIFRICATSLNGKVALLKNVYFIFPSITLARAFLLLFNHPVVSYSATPWTAESQASLYLTISRSLPKFMSIASVVPYSYLILWCSLLLLPPIFPSIRDFSNESAVCIRWPKYGSFNFSISASNKYSGFIFLKIDLVDLLAVQGTLRKLLQHHSWKASILRSSAFFTSSHNCMWPLGRP